MHTDRIRAIGREYYDRMVEIRHKIHMYPEFGYEEFKTAKLIVEELNMLEIEVTSKVARTGVVGLIRGKYPGKTVLLRADMDALPIQEETELPYMSQASGKMHACGHDGHTAALLGAAKILTELRDELHGNVKLVFQPAEEYEGGAEPMIKAGVLENPKVDAAFGLHLWGAVPEGMVHVKHGATMAAPDRFDFKVIGSGGHGATPHLCVDPIMITVQAINDMQAIISRRVSPFNPAVVSFCSINGGNEYNIIPGEVKVSGTIRTFEESLRRWIPDAMERLLEGLTKAQGASYEFIWEPSIPAVVNDHKLTDLIQAAAEKVIGRENVCEAPEPFMGGEDFGYFSQALPSSFFFVGISPDMKNPVIHHDPKFAWDDKNLFNAASVMAQAAVDFLNQ